MILYHLIIDCGREYNSNKKERKLSRYLSLYLYIYMCVYVYMYKLKHVLCPPNCAVVSNNEMWVDLSIIANHLFLLLTATATANELRATGYLPLIPLVISKRQRFRRSKNFWFQTEKKKKLERKEKKKKKNWQNHPN